MAVSTDLKTANRVGEDLLRVGFQPDEVLPIEGKALIELETEETGIASFFMPQLSRFLGCEQISTGHNIDLSKQGDALLLVHCPSDSRKKEAWSVLEPAKPVAAPYYNRAAIDHLAGGFDTN